MQAMELFTELNRRGLQLRAEGDLLIVKPGGALTDELRAEIRQHKPDLLRMVSPVGQCFCDDCGDVVDLLVVPCFPERLRFACRHKWVLREDWARWVRLVSG